MDLSQLELFDDVDVIQVGARNMQNFELLKELGHLDKPILLKRGLSSTIEELLMTAPLCIAGGIAKQLLKKKGITVCARINAIHGICDIPLDPVNITAAALEEITAKDFPVFDDEAGMIGLW